MSYHTPQYFVKDYADVVVFLSRQYNCQSRKQPHHYHHNGLDHNGPYANMAIV